jgi:DHA1 family bicyclomycin/chloramphenicol resistance-like MFS transporter
VAPDLATLAVMRLLAAVGGSASMVIPRAIVRDLSDGHAAARMMGQLMLVMGVAPILAPTLGGVVLDELGWQAIFWLVAAYGAICGVVVWRVLPETLPPVRRTHLGLTEQIGRYRAILTERGFITHALAGGFAMFGLFGYLGGAPALFIDKFHLSPSMFGVLFGCCAAAFIAASQVNPRILPRFGAGRVMRIAVRVYLLATIVLCVVAIAGPGPWWWTAGLVLVCMGSIGFISPNTTVGALSRHSGHAGSASALMGTMQFCLGAVSGLLVGIAADGTARPMAFLMLIGAAGATIADLCRPKRQ